MSCRPFDARTFFRSIKTFLLGNLTFQDSIRSGGSLISYYASSCLPSTLNINSAPHFTPRFTTLKQKFLLLTQTLSVALQQIANRDRNPRCNLSCWQVNGSHALGKNANTVLCIPSSCVICRSILLLSLYLWDRMDTIINLECDFYPHKTQGLKRPC